MFNLLDGYSFTLILLHFLHPMQHLAFDETISSFSVDEFVLQLYWKSAENSQSTSSVMTYQWPIW